MSTKSVIIAAVFAALIASLAFGVVTMGTWSGPDASDGSAGAFPGPEIALPGVTPDDEYVFLKLAHPEKFGSALSSFGGAMTGITENEALSAIFSRSLDLAEVPRIVGLLGGVTDFLDGAEQMALLATSSDKAVYISLFADDESFDKFISPQEGSVRKVEEWRADGWKFSVGGSPSFYMAKKPFENSNLVMVSFSEEGVDAMITASGGSPFVLPGDRRTSGEDCFRARVSPAALAGMEWMSGRGPLSIELSWSSDGRRTDFQSYTDAYGGFGTNFKSSGIKAGGFPILGDGDLVMFFTVDMPYVCFSIFPDRTDSVQAAIDAVREFSPDGEGVPAIFADDVRTLLASSRLSLAAVMDGDAKKVNQAYAVVESEASGPIDRLFTIAQIFINRPAAIEGWDSAYSITDGFVSESPFVLARKSNALMIGIGTPEAYGRMANVPLSIDVSGGEYLSNVFVSSQIIEAYRALQDEIASGMGGMEITSFLDIFSGVGAIQTRQGSPGTGDMSIFWKE